MSGYLSKAKFDEIKMIADKIADAYSANKVEKELSRLKFIATKSSGNLRYLLTELYGCAQEAAKRKSASYNNR